MLNSIFSKLFEKKTWEEEYPKFHNVLPYRAYDEDSKLYYNENSGGFILEVSPLFSASESMINIMSSLFTEGVFEGCTVQIVNWASPKTQHIFERYLNERKEGIYSKLASKRVEFYEKSSWQSLFQNPFLLRDFRVFISVSIPYSLRKKDQLIALKDHLKTTLDNIGLASIDIEPERLLSVLEEWLLPANENSRPITQWDKNDLLHEHLNYPNRTINISSEGVTIDNAQDKFEVRAYSVKSFPHYWAQWNSIDLIGDMYSDYARIPCPFLSCLTLVYQSKGKDYAQFKLLRSSQANNAGLSRFMPMVAEKEKDWRFVVDKLSQGQQLVQGLYQVLLYSKEGEADKNERYLLSLYKTKGWHLVKERFLQFQSLLAALPFTCSEGLEADLTKFGRFKTMVTSTCANIAPLQGETKGSSKAKMLLIGRRGQPFFWDPFENPFGNYNVAVIGKSGSGKSVFMQELVSSLRGAGGQVIVIDDGRSFMNSCILQHGTFVEFTNERPICINPFSIINEKAFQTNQDYREEVIQLLNLIIRQMARAEEKTSDIENAFIQKAIFAAIQKHKTKATISYVADWLSQQEDNRAKDLGMMLVPYTKEGMYSHYFEGKESISIEDNFYTFEFDNIKSKPDLQRIVLMVLIFLVTEKMFHGNRQRTVSLVIDEAWSLLHGTSFAEFIEGIARRARKYNGNLITGTQSIDDYYKNPAATAAIQNTDWFCLLAQNKESVEAMKKSERIKLDPTMEKALNSLRVVNHQYSEVMIYGSSTGWTIGRLILDPYSIALYSSKGEDFAQIKALKDSGMPLEEAIEIVADKIKRGK
jgi:conjugal transfer ATP-binding protein TraC